MLLCSTGRNGLRLLFLAALLGDRLLTPIPARAGFDASQREFKCIPTDIRKTMTLRFNYRNFDKGPVILGAEANAKTPGPGRCHVKDFTQAPIFPGKRGHFTLECRMDRVGSQQPQVGKVAVWVRRPGDSAVTFEILTAVFMTYPSEQSPEYLKDCGNKAPPSRPPLPEQDSPANCPSFRHDRPGSPFSKVKVRDQLQTGTCYSGATSAFYDYLLALEGKLTPETETSYLATAFEYKRYIDSKEGQETSAALDGGYTEDALDFLLANGACPSLQIEKNFGGKLNTSEIERKYSDFFLSLDNLPEKFSKRKASALKENHHQKELTRRQEDSIATLCIQTQIPKITQSTDCSDPSRSPLEELALANPLLVCENYMSFLSKSGIFTCPNSERKRLRKSYDVKTTDL